MDQVDAVVRKLKGLWLALLVSIVLYVVVGEMVREWPVTGIKFLKLFFTPVGLLMTGIAVVLRQRQMRRFEEEVVSGRFPSAGELTAEQRLLLSGWQVGQITSLVFVETVAVFGFVLRIAGGSRWEAGPFYAVAALLMVVWRPRKPG